MNLLKEKYDNDHAEQTFDLRKQLEQVLIVKADLEKQLREMKETAASNGKLRENFIGERDKAVREALTAQRDEFELEKAAMIEHQRAEIQRIKDETAKQLEHLSRQHEV